MAARNCSKPVKTFTVTFPGHGTFDEGSHARIVAEAFETDHTELIADKASVDLLPLLARQYDEPIGDHSIIPTYLVSRLIRQHATVALGGDGGDELFGGYPHYNLVQKLEKFRRWAPGSLRNVTARAAEVLLPVGTTGRNHLVGLRGDLRRSIAHINLYFDRKTRNHLLCSTNRSRTTGGNAPESYKENLCDPHETAFRNAARVDFQTTLVDDYLVKVDRASMLASLEIRSPFLDHRLVEFAFGKLPDSLRAGPKKLKILPRRLAAKLLPSRFELNRKRGFELPLATWFKGEWGRYIESVLFGDRDCVFDLRVVRELIEGQRKGYANANRLFQLTMFELWRREYRMVLQEETR
jgi:asparagine synthase (glutamine-hydrolysing)